MASDTSPKLPPRLTEVLAAIPNRDFAGRLEKVYLAAANAVARLTDIDLLRYETNVTEESSRDLSTWEEMAPVIRDTVMDVNALLVVIRATFPEHTTAGLEEMLAQSVGTTQVAIGATAGERMAAVEQLLTVSRDELAGSITKLGEMMRSPTVMSDRWMLLTEIQTFRTRFREEIGALVYRTAATFQDVARKDVVPGQVQQIRAAIVIRATVSDLSRVLAARRDKVREAEPEDVLWNAQQLEKEMDLFGRTPAYQTLRAQDKRALIEHRQKLRAFVAQSSDSKAELNALVDDYFALIQSLAYAVNPQLLKENDREVWAAAAVRLEQAQSLVETDPQNAAKSLAESAVAAQALYGREANLDVFLRKSRKASLATLQGPELSATLDVFRELLAGLPVHED